MSQIGELNLNSGFRERLALFDHLAHTGRPSVRGGSNFLSRCALLMAALPSASKHAHQPDFSGVFKKADEYRRSLSSSASASNR